MNAASATLSCVLCMKNILSLLHTHSIPAPLSFIVLCASFKTHLLFFCLYSLLCMSSLLVSCHVILHSWPFIYFLSTVIMVIYVSVCLVVVFFTFSFSNLSFYYYFYFSCFEFFLFLIGLHHPASGGSSVVCFFGWVGVLFYCYCLNVWSTLCCMYL